MDWWKPSSPQTTGRQPGCLQTESGFYRHGCGGPNSRKDYHYNETEEFCFQLEGDITVKIIEDGNR